MIVSLLKWRIGVQPVLEDFRIFHYYYVFLPNVQCISTQSNSNTVYWCANMTAGSCRKLLKQFQQILLQLFLRIISNHCFWDFLALCIVLNTGFFIVFFSWTALKYFRLKMIYLCIFTGLYFAPSHVVLLTLPSLHVISLTPDSISTRWKLGCVWILLVVMCSLWNVSLLNCTEEYYLCRLYLHLKHLLLLSELLSDVSQIFPQLV